MLYLSQILNNRVEDSADRYVGRLMDILVKSEPGTYSPLMYLVVRRKKEDFIIPYSFVENLSKADVSLKTLFEKLEYAQIDPEEYTSLNRDVIDQQIVDVAGARVVRVNDLSIGMLENKHHILGIDISAKGLLRRLGIAHFDLFGLLKVNLLDWRVVQPVKGALKVDQLSKGLQRLHPADLANIIEDLSIKQGGKLVDSLDSKEAAKVIEELDPHLQKVLIKHLGPEKASKIIEKMSIDEIVDLMQILPYYEAKDYLSNLQHGKLRTIENLIAYEEDTAGGLMTTDYITAPPEWTVGRVIEEIRAVSGALRSILFIYVVDADDKLLGPVSMRNLLISNDDVKLADLLKPAELLSTLKPEDKLDEIVNIMTKYNLYTATVLDGSGKLLGIVSIDDVMRCLAPKA